MVIGERPVRFAEQAIHLDIGSQGAEQLHSNQAPGAVPAVDHHFERAGDVEFRGKLTNIVGQDCALLHPAIAGNIVRPLDEGAQLLNSISVQ